MPKNANVICERPLIFPGDEYPDLNETDELYFSAGEHEDLGSLATIWSQERTKPTPTKPAKGQMWSKTGPQMNTWSFT